MCISLAFTSRVVVVSGCERARAAADNGQKREEKGEDYSGLKWGGVFSRVFCI